MDRLPLIASFDATSGAGPNLLEPSNPGASATVPVYPPPKSSAVESHPKRFFHHGVFEKIEGEINMTTTTLPSKEWRLVHPNQSGGMYHGISIIFIMMMNDMKYYWLTMAG